MAIFQSHSCVFSDPNFVILAACLIAFMGHHDLTNNPLQVDMNLVTQPTMQEQELYVHRNQNQHTKGETEASTSHEITRADESQEREGSAEKDATVSKLLVRPEHPCNYFGLAKQAFLKCLGFDSDCDNCNTRRHAKED